MRNLINETDLFNYDEIENFIQAKLCFQSEIDEICPRKVSSSTTLSQFALYYCKVYLECKNATEKIKQVNSHINKIISIIGNRRLYHLNPWTISNLIAELISQKDEAYARPFLRTLYNLLDQATKLQILSYNPAEGFHLKGKKSKQWRLFSTKEKIAFNSNVFESKLSCPILVLEFLGLRISELLALRWRQVDFMAGRIAIDAQMDKNGKTIKETTKNYTSLWIYMPGFLVEMLQKYQQSLPFTPNDDDFVFAYWDNRPLNKRMVETEIKKIGEEIGRYDLSPHKLRHEAASLWEMLSNDPLVAQALLRDKSFQVVKGYLHVCEEKVKQTSNQLNDYIYNLLFKNDTKYKETLNQITSSFVNLASKHTTQETK